MISIDDFLNVELKVGAVLEAEEVEGSEKLLKLKVDLGEEEPRQILAGIKKWYSAKGLIGRQVTVVANLKPRMMMGFQSQGMILATDEQTPVLVAPVATTTPGAKLR